ncbi:hypothetical protein ES708_17629 [subsurface metagenome]
MFMHEVDAATVRQRKARPENRPVVGCSTKESRRRAGNGGVHAEQAIDSGSVFRCLFAFCFRRGIDDPFRILAEGHTALQCPAESESVERPAISQLFGFANRQPSLEAVECESKMTRPRYI